VFAPVENWVFCGWQVNQARSVVGFPSRLMLYAGHRIHCDFGTLPREKMAENGRIWGFLACFCKVGEIYALSEA
jgi:hypothetical protein